MGHSAQFGKGNRIIGQYFQLAMPATNYLIIIYLPNPKMCIFSEPLGHIRESEYDLEVQKKYTFLAMPATNYLIIIYLPNPKMCIFSEPLGHIQILYVVSLINLFHNCWNTFPVL